ncbi:MAG: DUF4189 domain-containing protein [Burkholderiales bacterium]
MNISPKLTRGWIVAASLVLPLSTFAVGAIAVDDQQGDSEPGYGISTGASSKQEAQRQAVKECRKAGNDSCKVVVWFETCGAYAASRNYFGIGYGSTLEKAERMALKECGHNRCKVHVSDCE